MIIALEVEAILTERGYRTFDIVDTPTGALEAALARRPDLVTADYRIRSGTGVEAVARIVSAIGPVPVVYVTGNVDLAPHDVLAPVVEKPISASALARACEAVGG